MKALGTVLDEEWLEEIKMLSLEKGRHDGSSQVFEGQT